MTWIEGEEKTELKLNDRNKFGWFKNMKCDYD